MLMQAVSRGKGEVWRVNWKERREEKLAEVAEVRDIHVAGRLVGYCGSGGVGVTDVSTLQEVLRTDLSSVLLVRVLAAHYVTAAVASSTEVFLLQKKWVALQTAPVFSSASPITALEAHQDLLAVLAAELTLFSLSSLQSLCSLSLLPLSLFTFASDSLAFLYSPCNLQSFTLCPDFTLGPTLTHSLGKASIAPFHLYWLLVLTQEGTLQMLNAALEVEFTLHIGLFGRIVSGIGPGMEFFVLGESGIERFETCSEEEHIQYMVENGGFEAILELIKAKKNGFGPKDAAKLLKSIGTTQGLGKMQQFAQKITAEKLVQWGELLLALPADPIFRPLQRLAPSNVSLSSHFPQLPASSPLSTSAQALHQSLKPAVAAESPPKHLFSALTTTLDCLLDQHSPQIFDLLATSQADISHFLRNLTAAQAQTLAEIDSAKATEVIAQRWTEPDSVFTQLPPELQYSYYLRRWQKGLLSSAEAAERLLEEVIARKEAFAVDFLRDLQGKALESALDLASQHHNFPVQVYLLTRLNRLSEATNLLKTDLKQALSYLETHWNEDLWAFVLASDLSCLSRQYLACLYMHPAAAVLISQVPEAGITYGEIRPMLRNVYSATEIYRNVNKVAENERKRELKWGNQANQRGFYVNLKEKCGLCGETLRNSCTLRYCSHHLHLFCSESPICALCRPTCPGLTS